MPNRIYQATSTHTDCPDADQNVAGNIETITPVLPEALIDILKNTAEIRTDEPVEISFLFGAVHYTVKTAN